MSVILGIDPRTGDPVGDGVPQTTAERLETLLAAAQERPRPSRTPVTPRSAQRRSAAGSAAAALQDANPWKLPRRLNGTLAQPS